MWLVLLESAKDRFLVVDTPWQQVLSYVLYETTYWLIRNALVNYLVGCVDWYDYT
jgi:hypothetical protein